MALSHATTPQRSRRSSIGGRTSFPILHPSEIIQALARLGIEISKNELNEPSRHREKLRQIFLVLLCFCTGKTEEDFLVGDKVLDPTLVYVDETSSQLHTDSAQYNEVKLFLALRQLFESCGYYEFGSRDLYGTPTPKRLQQQLSAICNLAGNFYDEQIKVFAELNYTREHILVTLHQVQQDNETLNSTFAEAELQAEALNQELESIMQECKHLEREIARNNQSQAADRNEGAALKKQLNDLKDELATVAWALQEAEAEEENLRMQVVTSPDRRKAIVVSHREELEKQKIENRQIESELQDIRLKIVRLEQAKKELESINNKLDELLDQMDKYKSTVEEFNENVNQIQMREKEILVIQGETEEAKHQHKRLEEKRISQRKHHKLLLDGVQERLETAKSQLLSIEKDRREALERRNASEIEIRKIEAAIHEAEAKTEQENEMKISEYKEIERQFIARMEKRLALLSVTNN